MDKGRVLSVFSEGIRMVCDDTNDVLERLGRIETCLREVVQHLEKSDCLLEEQTALANELSELKAQLAEIEVPGDDTAIFRFASRAEVVYDVDKTFHVDEHTDPLLVSAMDLFVEQGQASISFVQRRFRVGYSRAARIVDELELQGLVGQHNGSKAREVLLSAPEWQRIRNVVAKNLNIDTLVNRPVMRNPASASNA